MSDRQFAIQEDQTETNLFGEETSGRRQWRKRGANQKRIADHPLPTVEEIAAAGPVDIEAPSPKELREGAVGRMALFGDVGPSRPSYSLPSLAEMLGTPRNGYGAVSTFSGCGGSCLGFRWTGWDVPFAVEFVESARDTYKANMPSTFVWPEDVRELQSEAVLELLDLGRGELDCLEGSPPCASFSTIGARERYWGKEKAYSDTKQRTDDLFVEYVRLLEGLYPKTFVAENVAGMAVGSASKYLDQLLEWFGDIGYRVAAKVLNASDHDVPQIRPRLIFVGVRDDLRDASGAPLMPRLPTTRPHDPYTLRDALRWAGPPSPEERHRRRFDDFAIGAEWYRIEEGSQSEKYFMLERCELSRPCPTITVMGQTAGSRGVTIAAPVHPREPRKFCVDEIRAICGFPRDFVLTGDYLQQIERMARAVPPPFMRAISSTVAGILDECAG